VKKKKKNSTSTNGIMDKLRCGVNLAFFFVDIPLKYPFQIEAPRVSSLPLEITQTNILKKVGNVRLVGSEQIPFSTSAITADDSAGLVTCFW